MAVSTDILERLQLEEISATARLEALLPEWEALWRRCLDATPFQSPHWLLPWWRHLGEGALWVFAWRDERRLRALVPLHLVTGPDGVRRVLLLGTGVTDILDAIIEPGFEGAVVKSLFGRLGQERARWDACDFHQLRPASPLLNISATPLGDETSEQEPCPTVELPPRPEELMATLPSLMRKKLRYYERRAHAAGEIRFDPARRETLQELLGAFLDLHTARWEAVGLPGVLAGEAIRNFHHDAARGFFESGVLRLHALRLNGRISGVIYTLAHGGRAYAYLSGFDPRDVHISPGALMIRHAITEAIREGAAEFDFLRGREEYKYRWGAQDRLLYRRLLRPGA